MPTAPSRRCAATASAAWPSMSTITAFAAGNLAHRDSRGILTLKLEVAGGLVERVCVDMGEPILEAARIPTTRRQSRGQCRSSD